MLLSDVQIRKLKPAKRPYRQSDEGNLSIKVRDHRESHVVSLR